MNCVSSRQTIWMKIDRQTAVISMTILCSHDNPVSSQSDETVYSDTFIKKKNLSLNLSPVLLTSTKKGKKRRCSILHHMEASTKTSPK